MIKARASKVLDNSSDIENKNGNSVGYIKWSPFGDNVSFPTPQTDIVFDSKILTVKEDNDLLGLIESSNINYKHQNGLNLLYRGSVHGFDAPSFHKHCEDKGAIIVLVYTEFEHVFGGYTSKGLGFNQRNKYVADENAFLFLLRSSKDGDKNKVPMKFSVKPANTTKAVYYDTSICVSFGSGSDVYISSSCSENQSSYTYTPHAYDTRESPSEVHGGNRL